VAATLHRARHRSGLSQKAWWLIGQLVSFEGMFVMFLYSNEIKVLMPATPIDTTLLFGAATMGLGAYLISREGIYVRGLMITGAAALFVCYAIVSFYWTPSHSLVRIRLAYLIVFNSWCVIAGAMIIGRSRERTLRFLCLTLALSLFVACYGMGIYIKYGNFRTLDMWDQLGFSRTYLNWGYVVADGAGVALVVTMFSRLLSLKQIVAGGMLLICASFLLVGGARGPMLGLVLAGMVTVAVRIPNVAPGRIDVSTGQIVIAALAVLAVLYIAMLIASGQTTTTINRFAKLFSEVEGQTTDEGASRLIYWPAAIRMWIDAPWIGHGFASFSYIFRHGAEVDGTHPHNVILEILCELGLVGLAFFGLFVWSGLRHATFTRLRNDPLMVCVVVYLSTAMMNSMFAKELTGGRKLFFAIALFALQPVTRLMADQIGGRWAGRGAGGATLEPAVRD
jgi:O-antigen ligase